MCVKAAGSESMGRVSSVTSGFLLLFSFVVCNDYPGKLPEMLQVSVSELQMLNK